MTNKPALLWLREDLRFDDNPAMRAAAESGRPVICVYILDDDTPGDQKMGAAQRWWLHHSLTAFKDDLKTRDGKLVLRRADPRAIIPALVEETGAEAVFWNRRYMPWQTEVDSDIKAGLKDDDIEVTTCNGRLLYEPWEIKTKSGDPYRVFTPFWKSMQAMGDVRDALPRVDALKAPSKTPSTDRLSDWDLLPTKPDWAKGFGPVWTPGEKAARARLRNWLKGAAADYADLRNRPDRDGTSRLSPHLHFGEISPVTVWHAVKEAIDKGTVPHKQGDTYLSEIAWREFSYELIYNNPKMFDEPLQEKFANFEWHKDKNALEAWQQGKTGYPIVDAGMRQLWTEGWMHNRVRMIVGSFLIKDLGIDWREGMAWFWDTLVDADPANNTAQWQWVAGCGADAQPFFRIFNPTSQAEKFDPEGDYIRKYVPELKDLPKKYIHAPEKAPDEVLEKAGITLGDTYPEPIVDHAKQREEALSRYNDIK
ncbi:deoxyribodipyrimidine photo-lyase [Parvularcula sp. LCG005]|uniref:cryptochrome/photolyase family protein n=1 Tax=Parvularcula sp. LCG005 TaxID=3078805 RepID=UPI002942C908|nr:deoxyribodipyrimidine photo-lyase [Parvularcula sp. LCG005]WOI52336.1 deoxyribodipyrimidine photo-lyase [Parvularcula sp. LCG005]